MKHAIVIPKQKQIHKDRFEYSPKLIWQQYNFLSYEYNFQFAQECLRIRSLESPQGKVNGVNCCAEAGNGDQATAVIGPNKFPVPVEAEFTKLVQKMFYVRHFLLYVGMKFLHCITQIGVSVIIIHNRVQFISNCIDGWEYLLFWYDSKA